MTLLIRLLSLIVVLAVTNNFLFANSGKLIASEADKKKPKPSGFKDLVEEHKELDRLGLGYEGLVKELTEGIVKAEYVPCDRRDISENSVGDNPSNDIAGAWVKMDIREFFHKGKSQLVFKTSRRTIDDAGQVSGIVYDLTRISNDFETAQEAWDSIEEVYLRSVKLACQGETTDSMTKRIKNYFLEFYDLCKEQNSTAHHCLRDSLDRVLKKEPTVGVRG